MTHSREYQVLVSSAICSAAFKPRWADHVLCWAIGQAYPRFCNHTAVVPGRLLSADLRSVRRSPYCIFALEWLLLLYLSASQSAKSVG